VNKRRPNKRSYEGKVCDLTRIIWRLCRPHYWPNVVARLWSGHCPMWKVQ